MAQIGFDAVNVTAEGYHETQELVPAPLAAPAVTEGPVITAAQSHETADATLAATVAKM